MFLILYSDPDSDFSRSSCDRLDFAVQYLSGPESTGPHLGGGVLRAEQTAPRAVLGVAVSSDSAHVETLCSLGQVGEHSPELFVLTRDSKENGNAITRKSMSPSAEFVRLRGHREIHGSGALSGFIHVDSCSAGVFDVHEDRAGVGDVHRGNGSGDFGC